MKMVRTFLFVCLAILTFSPAAYPQSSGTISGFVLDSSSGETLIGANVLISGTNRGTSAGLNGDFILSNVRPGTVTLVASYLGYRSREFVVEVVAGQNTEVQIELDWMGIVGEEVVISVQARGQISAINQQLASNTISNIVSKDRIQEMPDVNAAESVGRLPGVSIQRSGGEANKIAIRGLSPKYNTVTVNGVRLPSTSGADRSVDLSLIASNMLDGIEVKKAITPDMDAEFLGGTVDLRLREAPNQSEVNVSMQGGYNQLQNYAGNYKVTADASSRFFNNRFGVIANFNLDNYDRGADKFSGGYQRSTTVDGENINVASSINLREELVTRGRTGSSLLLDFRLGNGKIVANSLYSRQDSEGKYHINQMHVFDNRHNFTFEDRGGANTIFTGSLGIEQNFNWIRYDATISRTASRVDNPDERVYFFTREGGSFTFPEGQSITPDTHPTDIPQFATGNMNRLGIQNVFRYDTKREENQSAAQLNVQVPFRIGNQIQGYFKTGGALRWLDRLNDQEQYGRNGLYYGNSPNANGSLLALNRVMDQWNVAGLHSQFGIMPLSFFQTRHTRSDFLDGEYPYGMGGNYYLLSRMYDALEAEGELLPYSIGSLGEDYDGTERYQAAYIMTEIDLGRYVTLLGGVRYERDWSRYNGQRFREATPNNVQGPPTDLESLTVERENEFWLPMVHLIFDPTSWLKVRLARTETLTRPDYIHYAPISRINSQQTYARAANSLLKPAHSTNHDVSVSFHQNYIGSFTVSGYWKNIDDLIFQINQPLHPDFNHLLPEGLNIPDNWLTAPVTFGADTYINNTYPAKLRGVEFDWQTNFWYLPSPFQGLVLNLNYTEIWSEMEKEIIRSVASDRQKSGPPITPGPITYYRELEITSRQTRLPDQVSNIANITLGYDIRGFSVRLSYLYQTDTVTFLSLAPEQDDYSDAIRRWDIAVQQRLGAGIQFYANFNNITNVADRSYIGGLSSRPTYIEYYGFTMDVGVRYRL